MSHLWDGHDRAENFSIYEAIKNIKPAIDQIRGREDFDSKIRANLIQINNPPPVFKNDVIYPSSTYNNQNLLSSNLNQGQQDGSNTETQDQINEAKNLAKNNSKFEISSNSINSNIISNLNQNKNESIEIDVNDVKIETQPFTYESNNYNLNKPANDIKNQNINIEVKNINIPTNDIKINKSVNQIKNNSIKLVEQSDIDDLF